MRATDGHAAVVPCLPLPPARLLTTMRWSARCPLLPTSAARLPATCRRQGAAGWCAACQADRQPRGCASCTQAARGPPLEPLWIHTNTRPPGRRPLASASCSTSRPSPSCAPSRLTKSAPATSGREARCERQGQEANPGALRQQDRTRTGVWQCCALHNSIACSCPDLPFPSPSPAVPCHAAPTCWSVSV